MTEAMVKEAASRLGIDVAVEKITDAKAIAMAGVMATPGVSIDGTLVHSGGLPSSDAVETWLRG
jgi:hypothetical protein